ncbi:MAG: hypothetical protein WA208_14370 [Thermoanaerobaculia bacterium]
MSAVATFTPWIFLRDRDALRHENDHIRDLREALTDYTEGLERRNFRAVTDCEAFAAAEIRTFRTTFASFAAASRFLRDPHDVAVAQSDPNLRR